MTQLDHNTAVGCVRDKLQTHRLCAVYLDPLEGGDLIASAIVALYDEFGSSVDRWQAVDPPRYVKDDTAPVVVVEDFEAVLNHTDSCSRMGHLREAVHQALDQSRRVLLVSTVHHSRLAHCHASSVLIDAKHIDLRREWTDQSPASLLRCELKPLAATLISQTGLVGLATCFVENDDKPDVEVRRLTKRSTSLLGEDHGTELLEELRYATEIGRFHSRSDSLGVRSCGIFRLAEWVACESDASSRPIREQLLTTIAETIGTLTTPPEDLGATFALLFEIERTLRHVIVSACHAQNRRVGDTVPDALKERAAARAKQCNAPTPPWNVCEWLTTDELIDVLEKNAWMRGPDLTERLLADLRREVIPVRNAVAHFRASTPRERQSLRRWHAAMAGVRREHNA